VVRDRRDEEIEELRATIAKLLKVIEQQAARIADLEEKLRQSSSNSSKPPSSDGPSTKPAPKKKPTGRGPGGQPGHERKERALLPPEKVTHHHVVMPKHCEKCSTRLLGKDATPTRKQFFELPTVEPIVTEYALHAVACPSCQHVTRAQLPVDGPDRMLGPSVDAVIALLMGAYRMSKRTVVDAMLGLYGMPISVGEVVNAQHRASEAMAVAVNEAREVAQHALVKNADETSWREDRKRCWLWTCVTADLTVFLIHARRNKSVAHLLLGGAPQGVLGSDRHGAYNYWIDEKHQFCWSHLIRDFTAIEERGGTSAICARAILDDVDRMFGAWHHLKAGYINRCVFRTLMQPIQDRLEAQLAIAMEDSNSKTARTCRKIYKHKSCLWTFVRIEGVEPTNNIAERAVRHAVIYRKLSYGTASELGSRFVERSLTVYATLRQQGRNVLEFLHETCRAHRTRRATPSLLPRASPFALAA
jgi:transposase